VAELIAEVLFKLSFVLKRWVTSPTAQHEVYWLMKFLLINEHGTWLDKNNVNSHSFCGTDKSSQYIITLGAVYQL